MPTFASMPMNLPVMARCSLPVALKVSSEHLQPSVRVKLSTPTCDQNVR